VVGKVSSQAAVQKECRAKETLEIRAAGVKGRGEGI